MTTLSKLRTDNILAGRLEPEVFTIGVDFPVAGFGYDSNWQWSWDASTSAPYARSRIRAVEQANVPIYASGTYNVKNFAGHTIHGGMDQTHKIFLKLIDGAGTQNNASFATSTLNVANQSFFGLNGGAATTIQTLDVVVPADLSTVDNSDLNAPAVTYNIGAAGGKYVFSGAADGQNATLGPLRRGGVYTFALDSSTQGHPFYLTTDSGSNYVAGNYVGEYTTGVLNSRAAGSSGTTANLVFTVPANAPDNLYYACGAHSTMKGSMTIKDLKIDSNGSGEKILFWQHTQEGHKVPAPLKETPSLQDNMCLVFDGTRLVPRDLRFYMAKDANFRGAIELEAQEEVTTKLNTGEIADSADIRTIAATLVVDSDNIKSLTTQVANLSQQGDLTTITGTAAWYAPYALKINEIFPRLGTAADAAVGVTVKKNGSAASTFAFAPNQTSVTFSADSDQFTMAAGDYLTVDITSVGNTNKGKDMVIQFRYNQT